MVDFGIMEGNCLVLDHLFGSEVKGISLQEA